MEWGWGFLFVGQSLKPMVERCQRRPLTHTDRSLKSSCLLPRCAIDESPTSARSTMSAFGPVDISQCDSDVRFGSKADIRKAIGHVRFTPESGHVRCKSQCLLWANSGHAFHSITCSDHQARRRR